MNEIRLSVLGPVAVRLGKETLFAFSNRSSLALLIFIVENGKGIRHQREVLAEWLFPGLSRNNLRQVVSSLCQLIPAVAGPDGKLVPLLVGGRDTAETSSVLSGKHTASGGMGLMADSSLPCWCLSWSAVVKRSPRSWDRA